VYISNKYGLCEMSFGLAGLSTDDEEYPELLAPEHAAPAPIISALPRAKLRTIVHIVVLFVEFICLFVYLFIYSVSYLFIFHKTSHNPFLILRDKGFGQFYSVILQHC